MIPPAFTNQTKKARTSKVVTNRLGKLVPLPPAFTQFVDGVADQKLAETHGKTHGKKQKSGYGSFEDEAEKLVLTFSDVMMLDGDGEEEVKEVKKDGVNGKKEKAKNATVVDGDDDDTDDGYDGDDESRKKAAGLYTGDEQPSSATEQAINAESGPHTFTQDEEEEIRFNYQEYWDELHQLGLTKPREYERAMEKILLLDSGISVLKRNEELSVMKEAIESQPPSHVPESFTCRA